MGKNHNKPSNDEYRGYLSAALYSAQRYDGTRDRFDELIEFASKLEHWVQENIEYELGNSSSRTRSEQLASRTFAPELDAPITVEDVLDKAQLALTKVLEKALTTLHVKIKGVVLPPEPLPKQQEKDTEASKWPEKANKKTALIQFLNQQGIFRDDIVEIEGKAPERGMRKEPYFILEIPSMKRSILVCDQTQEATFVILGILNRDTFLQLGKEALQHSLPHKVKKIRYAQDGSWLDKVWEALEMAEPENRGLVDLENREAIITAIKKEYPDSLSWIQTNQTERLNMKIGSYRLSGLRRTLGLPSIESPYVSIPFFELGLEIYGDDDEELNGKLKVLRGNKEYISDFFKKLYGTSEMWMSIFARERRDLRIHGYGLIQVCRSLGIEGSPFSNEGVYIELARVIYGDDDPYLEARQKFLEKDKDFVINKIKEFFTEEDWATRSPQKVNIFGRGAKYISTVLGLKVGKNVKAEHMVEMGILIFGNTEFLMGRKRFLEQDKEFIAAQIRAKIPTREDWDRLTQTERKKLEFFGFRLMKISSLLGLKNDPISLTEGRMEIGNLVYGQALS